MGKGTIQSHLGEGRYSVELHFHKERVQQRIDWLTAEIAKIDTGELQELEDKLTEAQEAVEAVAADLNKEIDALDAMEFWQPETAYSAGQKVRIGARQYMVCEIGGVSGQGNFDFPTSDGQAVREDFVQWQPYRPDSKAVWDRKTWQSNTQFQAGDFVSTGLYEARVVKAGRSGIGDPPWPSPNSFPYPDPQDPGDTTTGPAVDDIAIAWRGVNVDDEITRLSKELATLAGEREIIKIKRDTLKLRLTGLEKQKEYLEKNTPVDPIIEAWCADLTTDLSGEVAVAEIPGERHQVTPLIRPGYNGAAAHDPARDGQLQPSIAGTAGGVFANWALRAAWQKWKPTYRLGTITSLSGDTCDVALDEALSSDQDLPLNQTDILSEVPIVYMQCNGAAFTVNDRVVVEFLNQDWEQPRVIGFESNPKICAQPPTFFYLTLKPKYKTETRHNGYYCYEDDPDRLDEPFCDRITMWKLIEEYMRELVWEEAAENNFFTITKTDIYGNEWTGTTPRLVDDEVMPGGSIHYYGDDGWKRRNTLRLQINPDTDWLAYEVQKRRETFMATCGVVFWDAFGRCPGWIGEPDETWLADYLDLSHLPDIYLKFGSQEVRYYARAWWNIPGYKVQVEYIWRE